MHSLNECIKNAYCTECNMFSVCVCVEAISDLLVLFPENILPSHTTFWCGKHFKVAFCPVSPCSRYSYLASLRFNSKFDRIFGLRSIALVRGTCATQISCGHVKLWRTLTRLTIIFIINPSLSYCLTLETAAEKLNDCDRTGGRMSLGQIEGWLRFEAVHFLPHRWCVRDDT